MTLRLAGEEFSVVQGLDSLGWLREIRASDTLPGLKVTQNGAGSALDIGTGLRIDKDGLVRPQAASSVGLTVKSLASQTGYLQQWLDDAGNVKGYVDKDGLISASGGVASQTLKNIGGSAYADIGSNYLSLYPVNDIRLNPGGSIDAQKAVYNSTASGEVSGRVDFQDHVVIGAGKLLRVGAGASDPASGMVAGDLFFNTTSNKLKVYNGTAWETVTSA